MNKKGLTLIELLSVIAIIAILFIMLVPSVSSAFDKAREVGIQTDLRDYNTALRSYFIEKTNEPIAEENINEYLSDQQKFTSFLSKQKNPYEQEYQLIIESESIFRIKTTNGNEKDYIAKYYFNGTNINYATEGFTKNIQSNYWDELENKVGKISDFEVRTVTGEYVYITAYKGSEKNLVIPRTIDGKEVIGVDRYAFSKDPEYGKNTGVLLDSVYLHDSIDYIGLRAFEGNNLTELSLPKNVTEIHYASFRDNKLTALYLPDSVDIIYSEGFKGNEIVNLTLSKNLKNIEEAAFRNNKISNIVLTDALISIGDAVFAENNITKVILNEKLNHLGPYAFFKNKIEEVSINNSIQFLTEGVFANNSIKRVVVPSNVKSIDSWAFANNIIDSLTLNEGLEEIKEEALSNNKISSVTIPNSVVLLGDRAFSVNPIGANYTILGSPIMGEQVFGLY